MFSVNNFKHLFFLYPYCSEDHKKSKRKQFGNFFSGIFVPPLRTMTSLEYKNLYLSEFKPKEQRSEVMSFSMDRALSALLIWCLGRGSNFCSLCVHVSSDALQDNVPAELNEC